MFNPDIHLSPSLTERERTYKTKCKMMIDFTDYENGKKEELKEAQKNHFFRCDAFTSLNKFKKDARIQPVSGAKELGKFPWELNVYSSSEDEDNDTEDSDSDEEGEEEKSDNEEEEIKEE
jgi:hypothetical protein